MLRIILLSVLLSAYSNQLFAYEILIGIESGSKSVWIEDISLGDDEIARMETDLSFSPSFGMRTDAKYLSPDSKWGYHIQLDVTQFKIDRQEVDSLEVLVDYGTSMEGAALYAVPVLYYHFNKGDMNRWNYKAGVGAGIGYLQLKGSFRITDSSHPEFNQIKNADVEDVDMAVGVYFEASFGNHIVLVQNYGPVVSDDNFDYQLHNILIAYRYRFDVGI